MVAVTDRIQVSDVMRGFSALTVLILWPVFRTTMPSDKSKGWMKKEEASP